MSESLVGRIDQRQFAEEIQDRSLHCELVFLNDNKLSARLLQIDKSHPSTFSIEIEEDDRIIEHLLSEKEIATISIKRIKNTISSFKVSNMESWQIDIKNQSIRLAFSLLHM